MNLRLSLSVICSPVAWSRRTDARWGRQKGDSPDVKMDAQGIRMRPPQCGRRALAPLAALLEGEG
jgi:hypothetical protein